MIAYRILTVLVFPVFLIYSLITSCRYRCPRYFLQRFGIIRYTKSPYKSTLKPLWFHCASVGETNTALPLIHQWLETHQNERVIITTNTVTSAQVLEQHKSNRLTHYYLPLDYKILCRHFIKTLKPRCILVLETEIWLNLFSVCEEKQIPIMILNGRLSKKTLDSASIIRGYYHNALKKVSYIFARSTNDMDNYIRLGATPERVCCLGNLKYTTQFPSDLPDLIGTEYCLAASTHHDEEIRIAKAFKQESFNKLLVIVPRHPKRGRNIAEQLNALGYSVQLRSQKHRLTPQTDIYIADTIGELPALIYHAGLVFTGGSLIDKGGQNVLEPAKLCTPQIVGPYTDNFKDEVQALKAADGLLAIDDESSLAATFKDFMLNPTVYQEMAERAYIWVKTKNHILNDYMKNIEKQEKSGGCHSARSGYSESKPES